VYADIRRGSSGREHQMAVGFSTTAIFGDLGLWLCGHYATVLCYGGGLA